MKKGRIVITQELLKKIFKLPEEAVITDIYKHSRSGMQDDCYEIMVLNYGKETPEAVIPEIINVEMKEYQDGME